MKPYFNDKYINLVKIRQIQRWWKEMLYKPDGLMFQRLKDDFESYLK